VYGNYGSTQSRPAWSAFGAPGPETTVLLGYVKNTAHWRWIQQNKAYNVRTQERAGGVSQSADLLYCQLLLLYCPETEHVVLGRIISDPELVVRAAMKKTGYPNPSSDYFCVQVSWVSHQHFIAALSAAQIDQYVQQMGRLRGEPVAVCWRDLNDMRAH
jgi:hypothetical protein